MRGPRCPRSGGTASVGSGRRASPSAGAAQVLPYGGTARNNAWLRLVSQAWACRNVVGRGGGPVAHCVVSDWGERALERLGYVGREFVGPAVGADQVALVHEAVG